MLLEILHSSSLRWVYLGVWVELLNKHEPDITRHRPAGDVAGPDFFSLAHVWGKPSDLTINDFAEIFQALISRCIHRTPMRDVLSFYGFKSVMSQCPQMLTWKNSKIKHELLKISRKSPNHKLQKEPVHVYMERFITP